MARAKNRSQSKASEHSNESRPEKDPKVASDEENDEDEDGGEEYEIEEILDAKRGIYPEGRMGYFVKWKGYDETENSWVDEQDAENAIDLVNEFWKKHNQKKGRKSVGGDAKPKKPRKSTVESEEGTPAPRKRGRKSTASKVDSEAEKEEEDRSTKKLRKSTSATEKKAASSKKAASEDMDVVEETRTVGSMKKYMSMKNWEDLVSTIDTVERSGEELLVYFTLTTGEQVVENSDICGEHFPRKMLKFYENNLRWRSAEEVGDS